MKDQGAGEVRAAENSSVQDKVPAAEGKAEELVALRERIAALESSNSALVEENSSLKDQYLRKLADYENFRKRMFREKDDALKFANSGLLSDLINVLDDFDRAIGSSDHTRDYKTLHDGVILIKRQMLQLLSSKYGLSTFGAIGEAFDPNVHEAVASELADVEEPMVSQEFLPGYKLHERVIRSAKVKVQMPAPRAEPAAALNPSDSATEVGKAEDGKPAAEEAAQAK